MGQAYITRRDGGAGKCTVRYLPGEHGAFEAQTYETRKNDLTPLFNGEITCDNDDFVFGGWSPTVKDVVTNSVTYTAQWTREKFSLYKDGDKCEAFSGGWNTFYDKGYVSFEVGYIAMRPLADPGNSSRVFADTVYRIDLTPYRTLYINAPTCNYGSGGYATLDVRDGTNPGLYGEPSAIARVQFRGGLQALDVSALNSTYYISIYCKAVTANITHVYLTT